MTFLSFYLFGCCASLGCVVGFSIGMIRELKHGNDEKKLSEIKKTAELINTSKISKLILAIIAILLSWITVGFVIVAALMKTED